MDKQGGTVTKAAWLLGAKVGYVFLVVIGALVEPFLFIVYPLVSICDFFTLWSSTSSL